MATVLGLEVPDLPDGWQPVEAVTVIKCLVPPEADDGGYPYRMVLRVTSGLGVAEVAGMAGCAEAEAKHQFVTGLEAD
jgi:hypothetical protein